MTIFSARYNATMVRGRMTISLAIANEERSRNLYSDSNYEVYEADAYHGTRFMQMFNGTPTEIHLRSELEWHWNNLDLVLPHSLRSDYVEKSNGLMSIWNGPYFQKIFLAFFKEIYLEGINLKIDYPESMSNRRITTNLLSDLLTVFGTGLIPKTSDRKYSSLH